MAPREGSRLRGGLSVLEGRRARYRPGNRLRGRAHVILPARGPRAAPPRYLLQAEERGQRGWQVQEAVAGPAQDDSGSGGSTGVATAPHGRCQRRCPLRPGTDPPTGAVRG